MKKFYLLNASQDFSKRMESPFKELGIEFFNIRSRECCLHITELGELSIYHKNNKLDLKESQIFIRVGGHDSLFISIIAKIAQHIGVPHNDIVHAEHTFSKEKITQSVILALNGIKTPESILCTSESFIRNEDVIMSKITFPCVLKANGSRGAMVWKIKDKNTLIKQLFKYNELFTIQKYIENQFDLRVLVYKNSILGAIKRTSSDGFYNNVSKGGSVETEILTKEEEGLAIEATKISGIDFAGVDIFRTETGPVVIEINSGPQIKGFESATSINVPEELAKKILTPS